MSCLDSGHHRILIVDSRTGLVDHIVGSGRQGSRDGALDSAEFRNPQGKKNKWETGLGKADYKNSFGEQLNQKKTLRWSF